MTTMSSPMLASPSNPRIKAVARLRDRRERDSTGLTLVDGVRQVGRAVTSGAEIVEAFICGPLLSGPDARSTLDALTGARVPVTETSEAAFARIAFGDMVEGIVAVVRSPVRGLADLALPAQPLLVVVEGVEKPGNLGAVLRSADGAGADAVIAASSRTDLANPNVIRASAGTYFAVPIAAAPTAEVIGWLRERPIRVVVTRVDADLLYTDADLTGALALVFGNEAQGLTAEWDGADGETVRLPMLGIADSLNVSASAAVVLYEARRQRDRHGRASD